MTEQQEEITPIQIEVARIERDTGIYTPSFITELPKINKTDAARYGLEHNILPDFVLRRFSGDKESIDFFAAREALYYFRKNNVSFEQATLEPNPKIDWSLREVYELHKNGSVDLELVKHKEKVRRQKRDSEIFKMEKSILDSKGVKVPRSAVDLDSYCEWIAKKSRYDDTKSSYVYWDLQEHYQEIMIAAERSFDPLSEWKAYLDGSFNLFESEDWNIQNFGSDLSYYALGEKWGFPTKIPNRTGYDDVLIAHSIRDVHIPTIMWTESLLPGSYGVCYSSGQVLTGGYVGSFIFARESIEETYAAYPFIESFGDHEREVRSTEVNSLEFCLGFAPNDATVFPDVYEESYYYPQQPAGRDVMKRWGENYKKTGELWTPEDIEKIEEAIAKLEK